MLLRSLCLPIMLGCIASCDRAPATPAAAVVIATAGHASISGTITLKGTPPPMKPIDNSLCRHAMPIADESVLVGAEGGLANVIVYLAGISGPADAPTPAPATLDQKDCRFVPHVLALRTGQTLHLLNSDDEPHDVHGSPANDAAFNIAMPVRGSTHDLKFDSADIFTVRCDVHPWMKCTVGVFDSGYFAVTDAAGAFKIDGLPPGKYDLHAWHERYGELEQSITIGADGASSAVKLVYQSETP